MAPLIVIDVCADPELGLKLKMAGPVPGSKMTQLLASPPTVISRQPGVAPVGTVATTFVADQLLVVAGIPLNATTLVPIVEPKPVPLMVTEAPTAPDCGETEVITGYVPTVKGTPLLASPPTATTTFPEVAPLGTVATIDVASQLVGVAGVPLNVIVLVLCVEPKLVPVTVTDVPTAPESGEIPLIKGGAAAVTSKRTPLLSSPPTVTTTGPDVAPVGTGVTIVVEFQLVGVAVVPLNVTVLTLCVVPKFVPEMVTEVPTEPDGGERFAISGATAL